MDRCPYTVPGMLLWLRNGAQDFDYTLYNSLYDPPSYGPKHALLVVDSHYWPLEWEGMGTSDGAHLRLNSRCQPGNATFTLQKPHRTPCAGQTMAGDILETKTFKPLPAVSQFHDALGYYPGCGITSTLIPTWKACTSGTRRPASWCRPRVTTRPGSRGMKTPATELYGADLGDTILGSGNPGDEGVQYGLHLAVTNQARDGSWGMIKVWNSASVLELQGAARRPNRGAC